MPRIPYVDPSTLPDDLKEWHDKLPPNSHLFLMLAHASATGGLMMQLGLKQVTELALSLRNRELAANAAAGVIGAEYLRVRHVLNPDPLTPAERDGLYDGDYTVFSGLDRAVVDFAVAVARGSAVDDATFAPVRAAFSDREIVELIEIVGYYWMHGQFANVLQIEAEPYA